MVLAPSSEGEQNSAYSSFRTAGIFLPLRPGADDEAEVQRRGVGRRDGLLQTDVRSHELAIRKWEHIGFVSTEAHDEDQKFARPMSALRQAD